MSQEEFTDNARLQKIVADAQTLASCTDLGMRCTPRGEDSSGGDDDALDHLAASYDAFQHACREREGLVALLKQSMKRVDAMERECGLHGKLLRISPETETVRTFLAKQCDLNCYESIDHVYLTM